jgi:hypothetical protein
MVQKKSRPQCAYPVNRAKIYPGRVDPNFLVPPIILGKPDRTAKLKCGADRPEKMQITASPTTRGGNIMINSEPEDV